MRNNISVLVGAQARKIIFSEGSGDHDLVATAVEFQFGDLKYIANATKEVIICAGKQSSTICV